jgi:hypothetical protein
MKLRRARGVKMKKLFYVSLWVILGLILSFILHASIEIIYLKWAEKNNIAVDWILNHSCALPWWLVILLPSLGIIFGLWFGLIAYRKIYVEKVRGEKPKLFSKN